MDRSFLPRDLGAVDIAGVVLVQADCSPAEGLREARWFAALASPDLPVHGIVAFAPLENGRAVRADLEQLCEISRVVGVRRLLQDENSDFIGSSALQHGLLEVRDLGLTFDICVRWRQLRQVESVLRSVEGLPAVLDHLGKPPIADGYASESAAGWKRAMRDLARHPTLVVKLSGLAPESGAHEPRTSGLPFLMTALELFGPERCMFGSDWPVSAHATSAGRSYAELMYDVLGATGLTGEEYEAVASRTASAFYTAEGRQVGTDDRGGPR